MTFRSFPCEVGGCGCLQCDRWFFRLTHSNEPGIALLSFFWKISSTLAFKSYRPLKVNLPWVVVAPPVHFVAMWAMAVVQVIVVNETLGRPRTCHKRQLRIVVHFFVLVLLIDRVFAISGNVNRNIVCRRHIKGKKKMSRLTQRIWKILTKLRKKIDGVRETKFYLRSFSFCLLHGN